MVWAQNLLGSLRPILHAPYTTEKSIDLYTHVYTTLSTLHITLFIVTICKSTTERVEKYEAK